MNHQPIGTAIIVVNKDNQILLGKRKNAFRAGLYGLPGGRIEIGEKLQSGATRELKEETDLNSKKIEYLCTVKEWQKNENQDFIHFIFLCNDWSGKPKLLEPDKCEKWEWFDLENLPDNILPGHLAGINALKNGEGWNLVDT